MAVDDSIYDIRDLTDVMLDEIDTPSPNFNEYTDSQLCIPQDPIEDLEWYPNFSDNFLSLNGICLTPEHETLDFGVISEFQPSNELQNIFSNNFPVSPEQKTEEEPSNKLQNIFSKNFPVSPKQKTQKDMRVPLPSNETKNIFLTNFPVMPQQKTDEQKRLDCFDYNNKKRGIEDSTAFANKKQRSKRVSKHAWSIKDVFFCLEDEVSSGGLEEILRKCTHCQTDNTPQWRVGPMGPKTLCNACGVRYKSGRLVPEYRPAASPTFDCHKHSNFHKKVLKKREFERLE